MGDDRRMPERRHAPERRAAPGRPAAPERHAARNVVVLLFDRVQSLDVTGPIAGVVLPPYRSRETRAQFYHSGVQQRSRQE